MNSDHTRTLGGLCLLASLVMFAACFTPSREKAIDSAIEQVKETMRVALPDVAHPEPYKYQDAGDCALVPGLNSSRESLRYQAEIKLPPGDNGVARQEKAIQHWVDKGATVRTLSYRPGPPNEVDYKGGRIMAFAMQLPGRMKEPTDSAEFWIVVTTPCISKVD